MQKIIGYGSRTNWIGNCPECSKEYKYKGNYSPDDVFTCSCGTEFIFEGIEDQAGRLIKAPKTEREIALATLGINGRFAQRRLYKMRKESPMYWTLLRFKKWMACYHKKQGFGIMAIAEKIGEHKDRVKELLKEY